MYKTKTENLELLYIYLAHPPYCSIRFEKILIQKFDDLPKYNEKPVLGNFYQIKKLILTNS